MMNRQGSQHTGIAMSTRSRMSVRSRGDKTIATKRSAMPSIYGGTKMTMNTMKSMSDQKGLAYFVVICVYLVFAFICSGLFRHFEREAYLTDQAMFRRVVNTKTGELFNFITKSPCYLTEMDFLSGADRKPCDNSLQENLFRRLVLEAILDIVNLKEHLSVSFDNNKDDFWTFRNAFSFVICATTTIGYGTPSPRTTGGRIFVVVLFIIGIPFTILAVLDAGKLFFMMERFIFRNIVSVCKYSYNQCLNATRKLNRAMKQSTIEDEPEQVNQIPVGAPLPSAISVGIRPSAISRRLGDTGAGGAASIVHLRHRKRVDERRLKDRIERLGVLTMRQLITTAVRMWVRHKWAILVARMHGESEDERAGDPYADNTRSRRDGNVPPMRVMILNLVVFVFGGAMLYRYYEGWTYWQSVYFIFTSISTVGFGDLLPQNETFLLLQSFYIVLGLSLLSMFISSVQEILIDSLIQLIIQLEQQQYARADDFNEKTGNYSVRQYVQTRRRSNIVGDHEHRRTVNTLRWWESDDQAHHSVSSRRWTVEETRSFLGVSGDSLHKVNEAENTPSDRERIISVYPAEEKDVVVMPAVTVDSTTEL